MTGQLADRWWLAGTGALGGALIWAAVEAAERDLIGERAAVVLLALVGSGFAALLAMAGPIGLKRALPRALGLALVVAVLVWLAGLRHDRPDEILSGPLAVLAALTVAALPVPFLIAQARGNWRDYAALFLEAWSIVVRYAAAWAFAGLVWLVILLSDQVLQIVGITVIADLLDHWIVPMVISGAVLGLGMAVVHELAELLSPYLVLRLFRLLLPVVLGVMVVFLAALPLRGLEGLFSGLSPALLLLTLVGSGVALVSIAVDQSDAEATQSPLLRRAAQVMALILPVLAALAGWAVLLRVGQHGWTPDRLFAALVALVGLAYAGLYALAVLRGAGWMQRIRQGNVTMALVVIGLAAAWLTPILNAEAISARNQLARFETGRTPVADLDLAALRGWGRPGAEVLAVLQARAAEPGQEALAARLAGQGDPAAETAARAIELAGLLRLQPPGATGTRDMLLGAAYDYQLADWISRCGRTTSETPPTCLMVVADLLPARPGEEALLLLAGGDRMAEALGLFLDDAGFLATRSVVRADGAMPDAGTLEALVEDWQEAPPPLTPALVNQLGTGEAGLLVLP